NNGDGSFSDHTAHSGLTGIFGGLNVVTADYNNDGHMDVFVLRGGWMGAAGNHPNSLLKNNGNGTFEDVTYASGLLSFHPTQTASWGDFNNDGWIDLFVGNEHGGADQNDNPSELYLNQKDGTFRNVASQLGLDVRVFAKGTAWGDINNDGLQDLYISNLLGKNLLFLNEGGTSINDWKFTDISKTSGVENPLSSFPTWFWDFDNDGWLDIFVASYDMANLITAQVVEANYWLGNKDFVKSRLYKNNGDNTFSDVTTEFGLDRPMFSMGANFGDLDNDGFLDMYIGTGAPNLRSIIPNLAYRNNAGKSFEDVSLTCAFGHLQKGHGVGFADLDNDGDQDIYTVLGGAYEGDNYNNALFENPNETNAWITLELEGINSNKKAIGSRIKITTTNHRDKKEIFYAVVSTGGSFGCSSVRQEMGLGQAKEIDEIEVTWSNGSQTVQKYLGAKLNKAFRIIEGQSALQDLDYPMTKFKDAPMEGHKHHH
ncbi:MAG: CRTAC1 family protein, partial [Saprospiraceae bacterium]|nr:CRTAC1 family protein [Saprospiraceae bacterium]